MRGKYASRTMSLRYAAAAAGQQLHRVRSQRWLLLLLTLIFEVVVVWSEGEKQNVFLIQK